MTTEKVAHDLDRWGMLRGSGPHSALPLEGIFHPHFPPQAMGLPVPDDWLGQTTLTRIGGYNAEVTLPRLHLASEMNGSLAPPIFQSLGPDYDWSVHEFPSLRCKWGERGDWSPAGTFVRDFRIALDTGEDDPADVNREMRATIGDWWRRVKDWIELLSSRDLDHPDRFHWSDGSLQLWSIAANGRRDSLFGRSVIQRSWRPEMGFGRVHYWSNAVFAAGCEVFPPLPWQMLRDALRAFERGQYRRCVVESTIGADVALTQHLTRRGLLPRYNEKGREVTTMLGKLLELDQTLRHPITSSDFFATVVDPRNKATHEGYNPTADEAVIAFDRVSVVVEKVFPKGEITDGGLILRMDPPAPASET